jgi:hypothetical protein
VASEQEGVRAYMIEQAGAPAIMAAVATMDFPVEEVRSKTE